MFYGCLNLSKKYYFSQQINHVILHIFTDDRSLVKKDAVQRLRLQIIDALTAHANKTRPSQPDFMQNIFEKCQELENIGEFKLAL